MAFKFTWVTFLKIFLFLFLLAAAVFACCTLPVEKLLKDFLSWINEDLGPWGPLVLTAVYIPLTILAVPASVLTLGGGYLFGLPLGFISDSVGATLGAASAFILGRTLGKAFVLSNLKDHSKFNSIMIAIERSGFKIMLLLRLAPLIPFNLLNYLLSVTPVPFTDYLLASWLGMMPMTIALVYIGTTLKDLSDVTHGWTKFSKTRWAFIALSIVLSVAMMICVTQVARNALEKALAENAQERKDMSESRESRPHAADSPVNLHEPLLVNVENHEEKVHFP